MSKPGKLPINKLQNRELMATFSHLQMLRWTAWADNIMTGRHRDHWLLLRKKQYRDNGEVIYEVLHNVNYAHSVMCTTDNLAIAQQAYDREIRNNAVGIATDALKLNQV